MRPRVVLVTGAPGSGKTTLARELSSELRVPFLGRDDIRGGLSFSAGAWSDSMERVPPGSEAVEVFLDLVGAMLSSGVSCVVEYVVRRHRPSDLDRLRSEGDCVVLKTVCDESIHRFADRNMTDRFISNRSVLQALGHSSVHSHTLSATERMREVESEMATRFPVPTLDVDTTSGYDPTLDQVIEFVTRGH